MEGKVHLCSWERKRGGYRAWLNGRPRVEVTASTFAKADEALYEAVVNAVGEGEDVLEYDPPAPLEDAGAETGLLGRLFVLGGGRATIVNADTLFSEPYCPLCMRPRGQRTDAPLVIEQADSGVDELTGRLRNTIGKGPRIRLYSNDFLARLTARERAMFEWRPVQRVGRARKRFFELVSSKVAVPFAVLKQSYVTVGIWECDVCGHRSTPQYAWPPAPTWFVDEASLPARIPAVLAIGRGHELTLAFREDRWRRLVGKAGTKGIKSYDVGIVDHRLIEARPSWERRSQW